MRKDDDGVWYLGPEGKEPCIRLDIDKKDRSGALNMVNYFKYCNLDKHMEKGEGTRLMLKAMLLCMKQRYSSLSSIVFNDNSYIPCHGQNAELAARNFLCYGKTWYMELGAVPVEVPIAHMYVAGARRLAAPVDQPKDAFLQTLPRQCDVAPIKALYKAARKNRESWNVLFQRLYALDCSLFAVGSSTIRVWLVLFGIPEPSMILWHFPQDVLDAWGATYKVKQRRVRDSVGGGEWREKVGFKSYPEGR